MTAVEGLRVVLDRFFFASIARMRERELDGEAVPVARHTRLLARYG